jgi:two-component system, LytTR family, response regulator
MLKAIIIDDIDNIRTKNADMISRLCPQVKIVSEANSVASGITEIKKYLPDLIFLDVELQDGTGFDLLQQLQPVFFKVIFITGFQDFAIKAFRFSALDYLLKPLDPLELIAAVKKTEEAHQKELLELKFETLFSNIERPKNMHKIVLKTAEKIFSVNIQDIVHCTSEKNYTTFHFINAPKVLISTTLKDYETMLSNDGFFRTHQSHLINMNYFDHYIKADGGIIVMKDKTTIPLATRKKEAFMELLQAR